MNWLIGGALFAAVCLIRAESDSLGSQHQTEVSAWQGSWRIYPTTASWSLQTRIPMMSQDFQEPMTEEARGKLKVKKKFQKLLLPLLLAYKLKFFTLIPVLIGGLVLLTGATGLAGFFFALFAAVMGLKAGGH